MFPIESGFSIFSCLLYATGYSTAIVFKIALNLSGPARSRYMPEHIIGYACYRPKSLCKKSLINLNLFGKRIVKVTIVNPSRQYTRSHLNAFHTLAIDV